jgi:hypothetical protein
MKAAGIATCKHDIFLKGLRSARPRKEWLLAEGRYPEVAEVHYDLCFLYRNQTPPDTAKMTLE